MRALWILAAGGVCALSALISAVWVAASVAGTEPSALRVGRQVLADDAAQTRRMLRLSCERDMHVERLLLELRAGGGAANARQLEAQLTGALGGRVALYLVRDGKLEALADGPTRTLPLLRRAADRRVVEDEALPSVLDACARRDGELALWVARSANLRSLLEASDLAPADFAFSREAEAQSNAGAADGLTFDSYDGASLRLHAYESPPRISTWLLPAALSACGAFVLGCVLALWFSRRAQVSETVLSTIERAAERVAQGDLSSTIQLRVGGRADQTFRSFDRMTAELREIRVKLAEAERAAAWQDIAQRVAHEIKNPLSPIKLGLETLRKAHEKRLPAFAEIFEESTHAMLEEVQRIEHIVREFSAFARLPKARPGALDLAELTREVVKLYAPPDVALDLSLDEQVSTHADREQISQVLVNLLANAIDAARASAAPRVEVSVLRSDGQALLRVDDNGQGVKEADRARIFEPYVTGKDHGTGLGLAIVRRIVQDHGGSVRVDESPLGGARFEVRLP